MNRSIWIRVVLVAIAGGVFGWWRMHHEPASFPVLADAGLAARGEPKSDESGPAPGIDSLKAVDRQRCQRFTKDEMGGFTNLLAAYRSASKLGSSDAQAWALTFSDPDSMPDADIADTVKAITSSDDPDAIATLSMSMGEKARGRQQAFGPYSGTQIDEYAWLLAACQLGQDCGAGGSLLRSYCLNGGQCGGSTLQQLIRDDFLSTNDYQRAVAESNEIIKTIHH